MTDLDTIAAQIGAVRIVRHGTYRGDPAELTVTSRRWGWHVTLWWTRQLGYPQTLRLGVDGWMTSLAVPTNEPPNAFFDGPAAALDAAAVFGWEAA